MKYFRCLTLGFMAMASMTACYNTSNYHGDGYLEDNGLLEARFRYVLTVDEINIGKPGHFEYALLGLPSREFAFGLEIELPKVGQEENPREHLPCNPLLHIQILDASKDEKVLDLNGYIGNDWVWSIATGDPSAFVYVRENSGKRFKPKSRWQQYTMKVNVDVSSEAPCELEALLVAKSRGWK